MAENTLKPLLVVEDNPGLQKQLKWAFDGYSVVLAGDRKSALEEFTKNMPAVVTLDLGLPPDPANASEGLAVLTEILNMAPHTKIIVVTGNDDRENALKAVSLGAYDFYQKPIDPDILSLIVDRAYALYDLEKENRTLQEQHSGTALNGILGSSDQVLSVCRMIEKVGPSQATTLIMGESGTGKELFARALHKTSSCSDGPFVAVNCAAIPENLLESELFGYEKGAFTGAAKQTRGKIEYADGGTFFLDEIGDMPIALQAKMLRFLQERTIERVGGREMISVDVRIICATHRDLEQEIADSGSFREDLFYRISEIIIRVPALRDRDGDRVLLAHHFLDRYAKEYGHTFVGFTAEALELIESYPWPGNIRELENKIKRAVVLGEGKRIAASELGFSGSDFSLLLNLKEAREQAEKKVIVQALSIHNRNISHAAAALGISRPSLYSLMKKLEMTETDK